VQEDQADGSGSANFFVTQQAPRILANPRDGNWKLVTDLRGGGVKVLAELKNVRCQSFDIELDSGLLKGTARFIDELYWDHTRGLLFTEGGKVQTLIGPGYLFVDGERCTPYDPRPHLKKVLLATIHEAPEELNLLEAFAAIRSQLC
jgi:hypothetical protein